MKTSDVEELKESIRQAGKVRRGEAPPHRAWRLTRKPDGTVVRELVPPETMQKKLAATWDAHQEVTEARNALGMTQAEFASLLGISIRTLHQWEQGRRQPSGAARVLLSVAKKEPKALRRALASA